MSGLLGLGGAIIMVPLLLYVPPLLEVGQLDMKAIAGITMVQVFFASLSGVLVHRANRFVSGELTLYMGGGIVVGSLGGAVMSKYLTADFLLGVFAGLALIASVMMLIPRQEVNSDIPADQVRFNRALASGAAFTVGLFGGMVGAPGAFILIPIMIYLLRIPTRVAVGTSLGVVLMSSAAGMVGKMSTGQIPFLPAFALVAGAVPGARIGALLSKKLHVQNLRLAISLIIALTAAKIWYELLF